MCGVCVCVRVCVRVYVCVYVCMYVSIYISIYLSIYLSIYVSTYLSIYLYVRMYIHPYVYVCMLVCMYVCMYTYVCILTQVEEATESKRGHFAKLIFYCKNYIPLERLSPDQTTFSIFFGEARPPFPFFFAVAGKGSGLVYSHYSSWHLRSVNLKCHH